MENQLNPGGCLDLPDADHPVGHGGRCRYRNSASPGTGCRVLLFDRTGKSFYAIPAGSPLTSRPGKWTTAAIILWTSLIDFEFAAAFILSVQTFDGCVALRDIAHRNKPKAARLAGLPIRDEFDFGHRAERLKKVSERAFCHIKGKISDVKFHDDWISKSTVSYRAVPEERVSNHQ
jgi:hypothetical protein